MGCISSSAAPAAAAPGVVHRSSGAQAGNNRSAMPQAASSGLHESSRLRGAPPSDGPVDATQDLRRRAAHDTFTYVRRTLSTGQGSIGVGPASFKRDRSKLHVLRDEDPVEEMVAQYNKTGKLGPEDVGRLFRATFHYKRSIESYDAVCRIMLHRGEYVSGGWPAAAAQLPQPDAAARVRALLCVRARVHVLQAVAGV